METYSSKGFMKSMKVHVLNMLTNDIKRESVLYNEWNLQSMQCVCWKPTSPSFPNIRIGARWVFWCSVASKGGSSTGGTEDSSDTVTGSSKDTSRRNTPLTDITNPHWLINISSLFNCNAHCLITILKIYLKYSLYNHNAYCLFVILIVYR